MKLLRFGFLPALAIVLLTGCLKNEPQQPCTPNSVASEEPTIVAYSSSTGLNLTRHSSGVYYKIDSMGTGTTPSPTSKVFVTYTGKLLNGTVFDKQTIAAQTGWQLNTLIQGWQIGLPLIKEGGGITLVLPSSLAYGCTGYGGIPRNAILQFNIQLADVQ